jgi:hypothetical protein
MISPTLASLSENLQRAASRRAYAEVQRVAVQLGEAAAAQARTLPAGDPRIADIAAWLTEEYRRADILVRVGRASQAAELRRVSYLQRYLKTQDRPLRRVVGSY